MSPSLPTGDRPGSMLLGSQSCHGSLCASGTREQKRANTDPNPHSDPQVYKVSKGTRVKRVPQVQKDREDFQDTWG